MVPEGDIKAFVARMVDLFRPAKVVLFGSYAYGQPTEGSDVDLLVITPHRGAGAAKASEIRLACPRNFSLNLLVRSPDEVRKRIGIGDTFLRDVISKGIVLHEDHHARVGLPC